MNQSVLMRYKGESVSILYSTGISHKTENGILTEVDTGAITVSERWKGDNVTGFRHYPGSFSVGQKAVISIEGIEHPFIKEKVAVSNTTRQRVANLEL